MIEKVLKSPLITNVDSPDGARSLQTESAPLSGSSNCLDGAYDRRRLALQISTKICEQGLLSAIVSYRGRDFPAHGTIGVLMVLEAHFSGNVLLVDSLNRMLHERLEGPCKTTFDVLANGELADIRIRKAVDLYCYPDSKQLFLAETEWADVLEHLDNMAPDPLP